MKRFRLGVIVICSLLLAGCTIPECLKYEERMIEVRDWEYNFKCDFCPWEGYKYKCGFCYRQTEPRLEPQNVCTEWSKNDSQY